MEFTRHRFLLLTVLAHAGFVGLLFVGSWQHWLSAVVLFAALTLSSTVFYHRLLSHKAWACARWLKLTGVAFGVFSMTGTPLTRTAVHRAHHAYVDTPKDPHSPLYTHLLHMYLPQLQANVKVDVRLAADVLRDPALMWLHRNYLALQLTLSAVLLILAPVWFLTWLTAAALVWFNIFMCNYFCHHAGLHDRPLLGLFTFGEGYHEHHHAHAEDPRFGRLDAGWYLISLLRTPS